jgi:hypothetical protein
MLVARMIPKKRFVFAAGALLAAARPKPLFEGRFDAPDGLVTNERAGWSLFGRGAARSSEWEMTSGSLFIKDRAGWSGVPDDVEPDLSSSNGTNSAVFRLTTRKDDFEDVVVSFQLLTHGLGSTPTTPPTDWDGVHVWLRYQSQFHLYSASVNRRDNTAVIKKKTPGGRSNGGTYRVLGSSAAYAVPYGSWQDVRADVRNNADGSVGIRLFVDGTLLVSATDRGEGGRPITRPGKVGIRGDNADFNFRNFSVTPLPNEDPR